MMLCCFPFKNDCIGPADWFNLFNLWFPNRFPDPGAFYSSPRVILIESESICPSPPVSDPGFRQGTERKACQSRGVSIIIGRLTFSRLRTIWGSNINEDGLCASRKQANTGPSSESFEKDFCLKK